MTRPAPYILPSIRQFKTLDELLEAENQPSFSFLEEREAPKTLDNLLSLLASSKYALVLAEAGFGKTRLVGELSSFLREKGKDELLVRLNRVRRDQSLERVIALTRKELGKSEEVPEDIGLLILDGIDEVEASAQVEFVLQLRAFIAAHPDIPVLVTARLFDYRRDQSLQGLGFQYFLLTKFSVPRIRIYLESVLTDGGVAAFSAAEVMAILENFQEPNWESIIAIPRYLELFVQFHLTNAKTWPQRTELYNYFVNKRLSIEDGRLSTDDAPLLRRLLEKIALIAEIYQRNSITLDEAITILEETDSALANAFLAGRGLAKLVEHSLCKANSRDISFEDRTLQEYLASCEIMRLGGQRHLYELVVDSATKEIHPSWHATLSFCVDHDPQLLPKLLDFANRQLPRASSSQDYHALLLKANPNDLSVDARRQVFQLVIQSYQDQLIWLDWSIARRLPFFFDDSLDSLLRTSIKPKPAEGMQTPWLVTQGNVVAVVASLLARKRLSAASIEYWKPILVGFATDDNPNGVLQRHALEALSEIKDEALLDATKAAYAHPEQLVREAYVSFCAEVAPNSTQAIETFIADTKADSIYGPRSIALVTAPVALTAILTRLNSDDVFLRRFTEHDQIFHEYLQQFFTNIGSVWTEPFADLLIILLLRIADTHHSRSKLLLPLVELLRTHIDDPLLLIISKLAPQDNVRVFDLTAVFIELLNPQNLARTVAGVRKLKNGDWAIYRILSYLRTEKPETGPALYALGRDLLPEIYAEAEAPRPALEGGIADRDEQNYRDFQFKLEPEKGKYIRDVFEHFAAHQEFLLTKATPAEMARLKELCILHLDKFDPRQAKFEVLKWGEENGTKSIGHFNISSNLIIFERCIPLATKLGIPITATIRINMINAIPYVDRETLVRILELAPNIQAGELSDAMGCYTSNDARYLRPSNLVEVAKSLRLTAAAPVLKAFVSDKALDSFHRRQALECLAGLDLPKDYFQSVYELEKTVAPALSYTANAILIEKFRDAAALRIRLAELKRKAFAFKEVEGVHTVSDAEHELRQGEFTKAFASLTDDSYIPEFLDLLKWSAELRKKGPEFEAYASYAANLVLRYFKQLIPLGSYLPIRTLEAAAISLPAFEGKNWLLRQVRDLYREYQFALGAPKRIIDCIRTYNRIKRAEYGEEFSDGTAKAVVHEILSKNLANWINSEGAKDLFYDSKRKPLDEPRIQKILSVQICREVEKLSMTVIREPQKLDDERVDYLISWGFSPNLRLLIELKKSNHGDLGPTKNLQSTTSHKKLKKYMTGYAAGSGFLLVLNVDKPQALWQKLLVNIDKHYKCIPGITVVGLDCR